MKLDWSVGYMDQGMGHGHYAVIDKNRQAVTPPMDKEMCEHIVKCVNNHERLIEALKDMVTLFDKGLPDNSIGRKACDEAKQALKEAS